MKQLLQNMRNGHTTVYDVPVPTPPRGTALVQTQASLVSAGTERMLVEFAEKNLIGKAQSRPDLVRQMLDKAKREGLLTTIEAAFNRLDQPMSLGYSSSGVITALAEGMDGFQVGDRVACAGGGYAIHAEYVSVPRNLLVKLPDEVDFESAAFTTLGAIAMHGFRLSNPQLGEKVAVVGLGLLGLLASQIALAAGCSVFGVDVSPERVSLARNLGITASDRANAEASGTSFTNGNGFDIVLICADAKSDDPVTLAAALARDRGCIVAVGAVGMNLQRKLYYDKELVFKVSRSYGPGRYDPRYEENGLDYPISYVRWTEGRNLSSFVDLLAENKVNVQPLITHRFQIMDAPAAYELITGKKSEPFLGVLLTYPNTDTENLSKAAHVDIFPLPTGSQSKLRLGVLGAGNYASAVFLPVVKKAGMIEPAGIASASGLKASHAARKFGFQYASSSEKEIIEDSGINIIAILTRHHLHARQTLDALRNGKAVYCEKPLAITNEELEGIEEFLKKGPTPLLMVGFNRRFAQLAVEMKKFFNNRSEPAAIHYRVNAGFLPQTHWTQDPQQGGGRIIGEACHFIDFLTHMVGEPPIQVFGQALPDNGRYQGDNVVLNFSFPDGSIGTVSYLANGDKSFPKEHVDMFAGGSVAVMNDFRSLELTKDGRHKGISSPLRQDKGHRASWEAFITSLQNKGQPPIPYDHLIQVTRASIAAIESVKTKLPVNISR